MKEVRIYGVALDWIVPEEAGEGFCWMLFNRQELNEAGG